MGGLFSSGAAERQKMEEAERQRKIEREWQLPKINELRSLEYWERIRLDQIKTEAQRLTNNTQNNTVIQQSSKPIQYNQAAQRGSNIIQHNTLIQQRQNTIENIQSIESKLAKLNMGKYRDGLVEKILQQEILQEIFIHTDRIVIEKCEINTEDRNFVELQFKNTTQKHFKVKKVERVQNPYLRACYLLRKKEYEIRYGKNSVQEEFMFHGTGQHNVHSIQVNNFDWRRHGKAKGNIFGKGVSFTPISNYASNYSDKYGGDKCMFGVDVLVSMMYEGNKNMIFPPVYDLKNGSRYDTSAKPNGQVIVKYRDDEFYPSYIITFTGTTIKKSV
ncbi:protein mono-ADP-ribosyltransferase PARP12-like [Arctopsyche grandis]|uniref:protein mono-ADP-ribosyltransferase PARP12-like n=1 Tax=Arctopsyche grandis TaxID=121162 RepID=UPI00406D8DD9